MTDAFKVAATSSRSTLLGLEAPFMTEMPGELLTYFTVNPVERFTNDGPGITLSGSDEEFASIFVSGTTSRDTGITTILPPNREICTDANNTFTRGIFGPSSRHQGGCHILMGDGAVIFITDSIEAGNSTTGNITWNGPGARAPGKDSPYGLWGALGTRAAKEKIDEQLNQ